MKLSVNGLGIVSKIGGVQDLELLLKEREIRPTHLPSGHSLALEFPEEFKISPSLVRRMSHFAKISLLSAGYALKDSGVDLVGKSIGIIQGSVYGPIISGIQAFDELIDFGDNQLSPTNFSGSVFNTSATYLSLAFAIQGCTLSHTSGLDTLYNSLFSAALWLENGTADYVLMGVGDEYTPYFDQNHLMDEKQQGLLPSCEGWTTFMLSRDTEAKYGEVEFERLNAPPAMANEKVICSVWHEQMKDEPFVKNAMSNQACLPVYLRGSYPSASAFDLALALVCRDMMRYPVYHSVSSVYQIEDLLKGEKVSCYSPSENGDLYHFRV